MNTIQFPDLGISLNIDPVLFSLGEIKVYWYGVIIAVAFIIAVMLSLRDCKKINIDQEDLIDAILFAAPIAVISSRLFYVFFSWSDFKDNFSDIFKIWNGGLAIYGAVIGAAIAAVIFSKYRKVNVWKLLDVVAPYLIMAQGIGRWGNFVNQEAFGKNTLLPWGMTGNKIVSQLNIYRLEGINVNPNLPVHPTFLYESLWNFAVFAVLLWYRKRKKVDGEMFFLYMVLYGCGRFWIEGLRLDSLWFGPFRVSQLLAFLFVIVFATLIYVTRKKLVAQNFESSVEVKSEYADVLKTMKEIDALDEETKASEEAEEAEEEFESVFSVESLDEDEDEYEYTIDEYDEDEEEMDDIVDDIIDELNDTRKFEDDKNAEETKNDINTEKVSGENKEISE